MRMGRPLGLFHMSAALGAGFAITGENCWGKLANGVLSDGVRWSSLQGEYEDGSPLGSST